MELINIICLLIIIYFSPQFLYLFIIQFFSLKIITISASIFII